ncbi:hypothetical protein niasHT_032076 [Heterodera trifolii]|uniref:Uncharacterized protein n=1 Tax=Heterodera trifolii TaxID=157864 RepID=A0ABD2IRC3_9BILA
MKRNGMKTIQFAGPNKAVLSGEGHTLGRAGVHSSFLSISRKRVAKVNFHLNSFLEIRQKLDDDLKWHRNKVLELQKQLQLIQEQQQTENAQANANVKKLVEQVISRQATCMAANQAQIHCTGCVECQGELFNI